MTQDANLPLGVTLSERDVSLHAWVDDALALERPGLNQPDWQLHALSGDAGFRRYYRIYVYGRSSGLLAVDAPPATEDTPRFVALADFFSESGVRVPRIFAVDEARGFLLVEDLGDQLLQNLLDPDSAPAIYGQAMMALLRLQGSAPAAGLVENYDQPLLRRELELFVDWFVSALLGYTLAANERQLLDRFFTRLEDSALEQPQVLVHRDYHSRNLLICAEGDLGVIDFQGALIGPCSYDPVSLLRDCYLRWPQDQVRRWSLSYANLAHETGLIPAVDADTWLRWFDWMGLQRHLKVLGIFSRLWLRDHRPHYLGDLSRVLGYVLEVSARYPELAAFDHWLRQRILPLVLGQDWYQAEQMTGETTL